MPKRLIDDSLLSSPSIAALSPRCQDAFPRFILLADDFGCFDANPRVLAGKGWPYREDVTAEVIDGWLEEMTATRILGCPPVAMMWEQAGRTWCYLTGWHGPHGQKHRQEYDGEKAPKGSKRRTPPPPSDILSAVMAGICREVDGRPPGSPLRLPNDSVPARELTGKPAGSGREGTGNAAGNPHFPDTQFQSQSQFQSHSKASVQPQIVSLITGGAGGNQQ